MDPSRLTRPRRAETHQAAEAERERIGFPAERLAPLVLQMEAVLLPRPIEERDEPVVEEVEPVAQRPPFRAANVALDVQQAVACNASAARRRGRRAQGT